MGQRLMFPLLKTKLTASWKTSAYLNRFGYNHYGVDMVSTTTDRSVYGMGDGIVLKSGFDSVLGNFMILKYSEAYNSKENKFQDLIIRIWHLASITVKEGSFTRDTKIAVYGNTGKYTTGAHLHLEVDTDTNPKFVNWTPSLSGSTVNFTGSNLGASSLTMTNPFEWLSLWQDDPYKQTFTTANDAYIRDEDKYPSIYNGEAKLKLEGIDVSSHNGDIDFNKVKAAGKEFVFIRIGSAGWDGRIVANNLSDKSFIKNITAAKAAGLKVGVYVYSYCKDVKAAETAAAEVASILSNYQIDYPVAFDIEDTSNSGTRYDKMDKSLNTKICKAFMTKIKSLGYYPILYTYRSFATSYLKMDELTEFDMWLAEYTTIPKYTGDYTIWQYKGDVPNFIGSCPGVVGPCDLDVSYVDYSKIINKPATEPTAPPKDDTETGTENMSLEERVKSLEFRVRELERIILNKQ